MILFGFFARDKVPLLTALPAYRSSFHSPGSCIFPAFVCLSAKETIFFGYIFIVFGKFMQQNTRDTARSLRMEEMDMRTKMPVRGRAVVHKGGPASGSAPHRHRLGDGVSRSASRRLKAIACLILLLAVIPAATCIATGHAGVPKLFSTVCGVVSCAAAAGSVHGW